MTADQDLEKEGTSRILHGFRTYFHRRLGKIWGQCGERLFVGNGVREHFGDHILILIDRMGDYVLRCIYVDPHRGIDVPVPQHLLHRFYVYAGIVQSCTIGVPQHMTLDPREKERIRAAARADDLFIAFSDDSFQSSVQCVLVMDAVFLIQEYEVVVPVNIALTLDFQVCSFQ